MKKYFLILVFTVFTSASFAQYWENQDTQTTWLISGGSAISFFQVKPGNADIISNLFNPVGYLGVGADFKINDYLSVAPKLSLAGKGGQIEEWIAGQYSADLVTETYELYYLQGSFNLIGHIPLGEQSSIFVGAGPFYGRSLFGTAKINEAGVEADGKVAFGNGGDVKTADYGATTTVGFQTRKGFLFSLNLDLGLANIHPGNTFYMNGAQLNTRSIYVSVGRSF